MRSFETVHRASGPRVLVLTLRRALPQISRCLNFEFEDMIAALDAADLVGPPRSLAPGPWAYRLGRLRERVAGAVPRARKAAASRRHALLFVVVENIEDLFHFGSLDEALASADQSMCFVIEAWRTGLEQHAGALARVSQFDHIAVGCHGAVDSMQRLTGRPCFYLPPAVDLLLFHPGDPAPERFIDVYGMGRRSPATHGAFLRLAAERGWFYVYDTFRSNRVIAPSEHRALLANLVKRTSFFVANKAKVDVPEQTGGQDEVGFRFFEGAAGGAVMIGERPRCQTFEDLFGWEDAVIDLPWGTTELAAVLDPLVADPARMAAIRGRNVHHALLRHDWVHRWQAVLERAGLPATARMHDRVAQLREMAAQYALIPG